MLLAGMGSMSFGQSGDVEAGMSLVECTGEVDTVSCPDGLLSVAPSRWERFVGWFADIPFIVVPSVSVSPETDWAFGVAGAYYFMAKGESRLSDISFDAAYSLNRQWNVNVNSTVYLNRWQIWTRLGYRKFPDFYYGVGNRPEKRLPQRVRYDSNNAYFTLQPQYNIDNRWSVGAALAAYYDYAKTTDISADSLQRLTGKPVSGLNEKLFLLGIGLIGSFDTRDQVYYPSRGVLLKAVYTHYEAPLNERHRMEILTVDFRHFVTLYKELIFAYQFKTEMAYGVAVPMQFRSGVGSRDLVRGVRQGMFADDMSLAVQGELRFPVYRVIRGVLFAGVGDVYNFKHWDWTVPKVGYGVGLRLAINKSKVNVRFDVARNNLVKSWSEPAGWSYYLTMKEAF